MTQSDCKELNKLLCALQRKAPLVRAAATGAKLEGDAADDILISKNAETAAEDCVRMMDSFLADHFSRPTRETLKVCEKSEQDKRKTAEHIKRMNTARALSGNRGGRPRKQKEEL